MRKIVFLWSICLFLCSSCFDEKLVNTCFEELPDGMVRVGLFMNAGDYQVPVSRGVVVDENSAYAAGRMPWVFVFKGSDDNATFVEVRQATGVGTPLAPYVVLSKRSEAVRVLLLANAPANFYAGTTTYASNEANWGAVLTGKTFAQAVSLLQTVPAATNDVPYNGGALPMVGDASLPSGITSATTSIGTSSSKIQLSRIVSKISITNATTDLSVVSWTVVGARRQAAFFTPLASGSLVDFDADLAGESDFFYVNENPKVGETTVILQATYAGTPTYYKLTFKGLAERQILPLQRNKWYQFKITKVTAKGYDSFDEAVASIPSNKLMYEVSVLDQLGYDLADNGTYYLGSTNSELLLYGDQYDGKELVATSLITNATGSDIGTGPNAISIAGTGISLVGVSTLNLSSSATSAVETRVVVKLQPGFVSGYIFVQLGTLYKTIPVTRVAEEVDQTACWIKLNHHQGGLEYTAATTPVGEDDLPIPWLALTTDGGTPIGDFAQPNAGSFQELTMMLQENIGITDKGARLGNFYLARKQGGRVKVFVLQSFGSYDMNLSDALKVAYWSAYSGAFWRWDQVGERCISLPTSSTNNNGIPFGNYYNWRARVVIGKSWIRLSTDPFGDPAQDAENYPVVNGSTTISGPPPFPNPIQFRIGLTSKHPAGSAAGIDGNATPRYGLVVVDFLWNGEIDKSYPLFIRQGEVADFVMRNVPEDNPPLEGLPMYGQKRTLASKVSPYNLTYYPTNGETPGERVGNATGTRYAFTRFPTQAGYYFQQQGTYAYSPAGTNNGSMANTTLPDYWAAHKSEWESCPPGYHRPADGPIDALSLQLASQSEWKQSLYAVPRNSPSYVSITGDRSNLTFGYYADGFFDRGVPGKAEGTEFNYSTIAAGTTQAAYNGVLVFNPYTLASIFLPSAGYRSNAGQLSLPGYYGHYGASSDVDPSFIKNVYPAFSRDYIDPFQGSQVARLSALTIRCFKD